MVKENYFDLDAYTKLLFWAILLLLIISIVTNLFSPYLEFIQPYNIDIVTIYIILLLIFMPLTKRIISIKYREYEIRFKEEKKKKELQRFNRELEPMMGENEQKLEDNKLKFIMDNKQYFEGFGYYYYKLEETIKGILEKNKIIFKEKTGLSHLLRIASLKNLIDSMSQKRLALFIEARNKFVHASGKLDLNEDQIRNILILASHTLEELGGRLNG
ncbi:MAG: hypothetical protein KAU20_03405 [Nanoarchaeota archaeon]|nr:hypothetical protein [Nanoarchaeota archaeon]